MDALQERPRLDVAVGVVEHQDVAARCAHGLVEGRSFAPRRGVAAAPVGHDELAAAVESPQAGTDVGPGLVAVDARDGAVGTTIDARTAVTLRDHDSHRS
jgi:hypothetical protein